ncbi:hypothetical protein [Streptomyces sp. cmx-4-9]|uniref:hypothetical protein n=1 Tax=Streptomyces sp. cmx-4-9 TaxID=2790941 RepID=UPI00397E974D
MKRRPLAVVAATAGALACAAFALPNLPPNPVTRTLDAQVFHEKGRRFATAAEAPKGPGAPFALPSWIPGDATDVRIRVRTGGGARLIRFTLGATPLEGPQCTAGTPRPMKGPRPTARWWPDDTRAEERTECRGAHQYRVAVRGREVYAWTDGTAPPGRADGAGRPPRGPDRP